LLECIFASPLILWVVLNTAKFSLDFGSGVVDTIFLGDSDIAPMTNLNNSLDVTEQDLWVIIDAMDSHLGCVEGFNSTVCVPDTTETFFLCTFSKLSKLMVVLQELLKFIEGLLIVDMVWRVVIDVIGILKHLIIHDSDLVRQISVAMNISSEYGYDFLGISSEWVGQSNLDDGGSIRCLHSNYYITSFMVCFRDTRLTSNLI
jgi:hypothetical protein